MAHGSHAPITDESREIDAAAGHQHHPTPATYFKVGAILTVVTIIEVWVYYIPALVASPVFVPLLVVLSAFKFTLVMLFYMHLKYDHRIFRGLFTGPLIIAFVTIVGLMFLFGKAAFRLGVLT